MQLYLIRHAESENNARPAYERVEDPGLTSVGRLQAQHLARWMATQAVDVLITSPFRRTLQTTQHLVDVAPQSVRVWHDVFERGGCFRGHGPNAIQGGDGFDRKQIEAQLQCGPNPLLIDETITSDGWWGGRDRETDAEAIQRAKKLHQRIVLEFGDTDHRVFVITHADFKVYLLQELLRGVIDTDRLGLLRNTGVTRLSYISQNDIDRRWQLEWLNSVSHLPAKLCDPQ